MSVIRHPNTAGATLTQWRYTATGGETSLSGTDGFSTALSYTVGSEQVFINGVLLERGVDYAATTGTTITGLTALVANDIATVISPSSFNVANAIPKSTVTAKGDLLAATGASTVTNLPVGADGTTLVADSSTSTGLRYQTPKTQNAVYNSGFDLWQRGTSSTANASAAGNGYTADRWQSVYSTGAITTSRQATSDTTNLPNIQYCARVQRNSGQTATTNVIISQTLETVDSIRFTGQAVTLSFWARAGANYSASASGLIAGLFSGTGTDQNVLFSFTSQSTVVSATRTLTTTWQRFSITGTVATTATELGYYFYYAGVGTAGANDYFEITGVQLETGSVATPFNRMSGTLQGELAACQRYYQRFNASSVYTFFCNGNAYSTTQATTILPLPVTLRTAPSSIETTGTASNYRLTNGATATACNSVPALDQAATQSLAINFYVASGLTAGQAINAGANNTASAYIGVSAEL